MINLYILICVYHTYHIPISFQSLTGPSTFRRRSLLVLDQETFVSLVFLDGVGTCIYDHNFYNQAKMHGHDISRVIIEGSLEVKLPTTWTDEKQNREEAERRERLEEIRVEEKE